MSSVRERDRRAKAWLRAGGRVAAAVAAAGVCAVALQAVSANAGADPSAFTGRLVTATATATPASTSSGSADLEAKAREFTECMRTHGVTDFPEVTIKPNGQIQLNGGKINPFDETYRAAARACAGILPSGSGLPDDPRPPKPSVPALPFTCSENCPAPPKAPSPPF